MFNEGKIIALRAALAAFALMFFVGLLRGMSVHGACWRSAVVALACLLAVKVVHYFFYNALMDALSGHVQKGKESTRPRTGR